MERRNFFQPSGLVQRPANGLARRLGMAGAVVVFLSGCAVSQATRCNYANWEALGARDAEQGAPLIKFEAYRNACAAAGVAPDAAAYQKGWSGARRQGKDPSQASKPRVALSPEAQARRDQLQNAIQNFDTNIASLNREIGRLQAEADGLAPGSAEQNAVLARQRRLTALMTEQMGARSAASLNMQVIDQGLSP